MNSIISYDEVKLYQDDYLHFWEDSFGPEIVFVAGILFEKINSNEIFLFKQNPQCDFIILPSIENSFQQFVFVAFAIPVLLEGPIACGKSSLISHRAKFTGRFSGNVSVQISEQVDTKFLLGFYVCNDRPGDFSFNWGPLLKNIEAGNWIVLEDIHSASPKVVNSLQSIIENQSVSSISGYENKIRSYNSEFKIFFTRRLFHERSSIGSERTVIKLLEKMCKILYIFEVPDTEIEHLIGSSS